jgi:hypothetical protein
MKQKTEDEKELATLDCTSSLSLQGDAPIYHSSKMTFAY